MTLAIVITGAAGFVGAEVAQQACDRGHKVTGVDLRKTASDERFVVADVTDSDQMLKIASGADVIIHCAAIVGPAPATADPQLATRVNVDGTLAVLEAIRARSARAICLSTATLYGNDPDCKPNDEAAHPNPVGIYDATKLMAETLCDAYRKSYSADVASIRTSFVYGPKHSTGDYFVTRCLAGETRIVEAGRDHPCEFTYVKDLARGLVLAAEAAKLNHGVYNISSGITRTRGDLAKIVMREFPEAEIELAEGVDGRRHLRGPCRIKRAREDFGYSPAYTLENGIRDWVRVASK